MTGDSILFKLGAELEKAWAQESRLSVAGYDEDIVNAAFDVTAGIVHKIEAIPAKTIQDVHVKVRACLWCHSGTYPAENLVINQDDCTDLRLMMSIVNDLISINSESRGDHGAQRQATEAGDEKADGNDQGGASRWTRQHRTVAAQGAYSRPPMLVT